MTYVCMILSCVMMPVKILHNRGGVTVDYCTRQDVVAVKQKARFSNIVYMIYHLVFEIL